MRKISNRLNEEDKSMKRRLELSLIFLGICICLMACGKNGKEEAENIEEINAKTTTHAENNDDKERR